MTDNDQANEGVDRQAAADELIMAALATGHSYKEAGALANVSSKTVQRRMATPEFAAEVRRQRDEHAARITNMLTSLEEQAVQTLSQLLSADRDADRLRAAQLMLSVGHQRRQTDDLVRRLDELDRQVQAGAHPNKDW